MNKAPIALGEYKVGESLANGGFGFVFSGEGPEGLQVALKYERTYPRIIRPYLQHEADVYRVLEGDPRVPKVYKYGREARWNIMASDLLGSSLESLREKCDNHFTLKTVLMLASQMIDCVQYVHSKGIIHRDIKPDNFLMGRPGTDREDCVHIVDFGLARRYRHPKTLEHFPKFDGHSFFGTKRFASLGALDGKSQGRKDDLESTAYSLIYFLRETLPWQGLRGGTDKHRDQRVREKKRSWTPERLCEGLPGGEELAKMLSYVKSLNYEDEPDYEMLKALFHDRMKKEGWTMDCDYDWKHVEVEDSESEISSPSLSLQYNFDSAAFPEPPGGGLHVEEKPANSSAESVQINVELPVAAFDLEVHAAGNRLAALRRRDTGKPSLQDPPDLYTLEEEDEGCSAEQDAEKKQVMSSSDNVEPASLLLQGSPAPTLNIEPNSVSNPGQLTTSTHVSSIPEEEVPAFRAESFDDEKRSANIEKIVNALDAIQNEAGTHARAGTSDTEFFSAEDPDQWPEEEAASLTAHRSGTSYDAETPTEVKDSAKASVVEAGKDGDALNSSSDNRGPQGLSQPPDQASNELTPEYVKMPEQTEKPQEPSSKFADKIEDVKVPSESSEDSCAWPGTPLRRGDIILAKLFARQTLEFNDEDGTNMGDPSYWHDPELSREEWKFNYRPGVITGFKDDRFGYLKVYVTPLMHREDGLDSIAMSRWPAFVPIRTARSAKKLEPLSTPGQEVKGDEHAGEGPETRENTEQPESVKLSNKIESKIETSSAGESEDYESSFNEDDFEVEITPTWPLKSSYFQNQVGDFRVTVDPEKTHDIEVVYRLTSEQLDLLEEAHEMAMDSLKDHGPDSEDGEETTEVRWRQRKRPMIRRYPIFGEIVALTDESFKDPDVILSGSNGWLPEFQQIDKRRDRENYEEIGSEADHYSDDDDEENVSNFSGRAPGNRRLSCTLDVDGDAVADASLSQAESFEFDDEDDNVSRGSRRSHNSARSGISRRTSMSIHSSDSRSSHRLKSKSGQRPHIKTNKSLRRGILQGAARAALRGDVLTDTDGSDADGDADESSPPSPNSFDTNSDAERHESFPDDPEPSSFRTKESPSIPLAGTEVKDPADTLSTSASPAPAPITDSSLHLEEDLAGKAGNGSTAHETSSDESYARNVPPEALVRHTAFEKGKWKAVEQSSSSSETSNDGAFTGSAETYSDSSAIEDHHPYLYESSEDAIDTGKVDSSSEPMTGSSESCAVFSCSGNSGPSGIMRDSDSDSDAAVASIPLGRLESTFTSDDNDINGSNELGSFEEVLAARTAENAARDNSESSELPEESGTGSTSSETSDISSNGENNDSHEENNYTHSVGGSSSEAFSAMASGEIDDSLAVEQDSLSVRSNISSSPGSRSFTLALLGEARSAPVSPPQVTTQDVGGFDYCIPVPCGNLSRPASSPSPTTLPDETRPEPHSRAASPALPPPPPSTAASVVVDDGGYNRLVSQVTRKVMIDRAVQTESPSDS